MKVDYRALNTCGFCYSHTLVWKSGTYTTCTPEIIVSATTKATKNDPHIEQSAWAPCLKSPLPRSVRYRNAVQSGVMCVLWTALLVVAAEYGYINHWMVWNPFKKLQAQFAMVKGKRMSLWCVSREHTKLTKTFSTLPRKQFARVVYLVPGGKTHGLFYTANSVDDDELATHRPGH